MNTTTDETKMITKTCKCGTQFETESMPKYEFLENNLCGPCDRAKEKADKEWFRIKKEEDAKREAERVESLVDSIRNNVDWLTPERILATDLSDQRFNSALWEQVAIWNPSKEKPWLGLVGDPGESKTRCAYLLIRQMAEAWTRRDGEKPKVAAITGSDFKRWVLDRYSKETIQNPSHLGYGTIPVSEIVASKLRDAKNADILLFDEIGEKIKPTATVIEELFGFIDHRHSRNLVTIWTCNSRPEKFCAGWPEEFAGPIAGRIVESSTIICP